MSAPLAGKFQDHYLVLGVEPTSDSETIQSVYAKLAQKYHPKNPDTGNQEKFEAVNLAYEVLSNPELRLEFDKLKGIGQKEGTPKFSGAAFFENLGRDAAVRSAVLCVLYDRRRTKPFTPSLSMRHMENLLAVTTEELSFALWYLKYQGLAVSDDKSALQITVEGINYLGAHRPSAEAVMPLIKEPVEAVTSEPKAEPKPQPAAPPEPVTSDGSSLRNLLSRALAKG